MTITRKVIRKYSNPRKEIDSMRTSKNFRRLLALTAALALTATASMSVLAQAEESNFAIVEAAEDAEVLSVREVAKKCRTSVVAIETETKVIYNDYDSNYYSPFGSMFGYR